MSPFKQKIFELLRDELVEMKNSDGGQSLNDNRNNRIEEIKKNSVQEKNVTRMRTFYRAVERKVNATRKVIAEQAAIAEQIK